MGGWRPVDAVKMAIFGICLVVVNCLPHTAHAYIGPGAGFAIVSSFLIVFGTAILSVITLLSWPLRAIYLMFKRRGALRNSRIRRAVIIGFDGLDPDLCRRWMSEGKLPNLKKLAETGCFRPLETTTPPISPVAWSSFATGVNPGKHRIFDFFTRDLKTYQPRLSSARIQRHQKRVGIGSLSFPIEKTTVNLLRKSESVWSLLSQHKIFSTVLRVPITFPPECFYGVCLSAMCVPDLRGTQGSFTFFTTDETDLRHRISGGNVVLIQMIDRRFQATIIGPSAGKGNRQERLVCPIEGIADADGKTIRLKIGDRTIHLSQGVYSPWITLTFSARFRKRIRGVARFLVTEVNPHLKIYVTPIHIDPEKPVLPISHPFYFSICLSKLLGTFSTLGLAEDTWALDEDVIDEQAFLDQAYDIYEERKKLFLRHLKKNTEGLLVFVFDTTDRIQHMFFRYLYPDHPANRGRSMDAHKDAIETLYRKADAFTGDVLARLKPDDLLIVMSDHGFKPFKWGVNLNTWLFNEGYLVLKNGTAPGREWLTDVDWSQTRAYAFGLAGIFVNTRNRERLGIVDSEKAKSDLIPEIQSKLEALYDNASQKRPIRKAFAARDVLKGPYVPDAPDIIVGYEEGYRASWNCAKGVITDQVIEDNTRRWSGDHCMAPELVPGVFFSNWTTTSQSPTICDIAPTLMNLFGLKAVRFQDGRILEMDRNGVAMQETSN